MPNPVRTIVVHGAQLDEVVAVYIAKKYGRQRLPGSDLAGVEFVPANYVPPDGLSADEWLERGVVYLGVGGGMFDHRPGPGQERRSGQSASRLIAEFLQVSNRGELRILLEYTTKQENEGDRDLLKLGRLVASLCEEHADSPQFVMDIAGCVIDAHVGSQRRFREARRVLEQAGQIDLGMLEGKPCFMAVVQSDNQKVKAMAFSAQGGYKTALVQQTSSGHTSVFLNNYSGLMDLASVAREIRRLELLAREPGYKASEEELSGEFCQLVPEWFFHSKASWLLNQDKGGTPPTSIPLEKITETVATELRRQIGLKFEEMTSPSSEPG